MITEPQLHNPMDDERPTPRARLAIEGRVPWIHVQLEAGSTFGALKLPPEFARDLASCINRALQDMPGGN